MKKTAIGTGSLVLIGVIVIIIHALALGAVAGAENGRSPFTAMPLRDGKNVGVLAPGEARWYIFVQAGTGGAFQRQMDLTLVFTPENGRRIHHVNFQIFPADQVTRWYWEDVSRMQNMGAGGIVSRDGNPVTGERLWSGWVVDSDTYYVQVQNNADATVDFWLFTDNVISAELGESSAVAPAADVPAGFDPNHPRVRSILGANEEPASPDAALFGIWGCLTFAHTVPASLRENDMAPELQFEKYWTWP